MTAPTINLLFVAQGGWRRKGLRLVLEACRRLAAAPSETAWRLDMLGMPGKGEDELLAPFHREVEAGQIHPLGFLSQVDEVYARADVLVVGSYYEAFSLVMLEALEHGLPIITTPVNGAREAVREGWNGFIVDWNPEAMAGAIRRLANDPGLRTLMGERSREHAQRFSLDLVARQTEDLYEQIRHG